MTRTHWLAIALLGVMIVFVAVRLGERDDKEDPLTFGSPIDVTVGPDAATYGSAVWGATQSTPSAASAESAIPAPAEGATRNPTAMENLGFAPGSADATGVAGAGTAAAPAGAVAAPGTSGAPMAGDGGVARINDAGGVRDGGVGGATDAGGMRDGGIGGATDAGGVRDAGAAAEVGDVGDGGAEVNDVADGGAPVELAPIPDNTPQEPGESPGPAPGNSNTPPSGQIPAPGTGENVAPGTGENVQPGTGENVAPGTGENIQPGSGDSTTLPP